MLQSVGNARFFALKAKAQYRSFSSTRSRLNTVDLSYNHLVVEAPSRPLVILHGLLGFKRNWQSLSKAFQRKLNRDVYTLDLRNHGSSPHQTPMTYSAMAGDVLHFCEKRGLKNITLLGHSMGGKVAMTVALHEKLPDDLLADLIVADISPAKGPLSKEFTGYIEGMRLIEQKGVGSRKEADSLLKPYESDYLTRAFLLSNLSTSPNEKSQLHFQVPLDILHNSLDEIGSFPYEPGERQWDGHTLFVKGTRSKYINSKNLPLAYQYFPSMQLKELDAGHWVHSEKPNEFLDLVSEFVSEKA